MINYSYCQLYTQPVYLEPKLYDYQLADKNYDFSTMQAPVYSYTNATSFLDHHWQNPNNLSIPRCTIDFTVPTTMKGPVFMYYRLTNFYQNHRQYIKNFDFNQLQGDRVDSATLHTNCDPLAYSSDGKVIYPCGLIANSMFNGNIIKNDSFSLYTNNSSKTRLRILHQLTLQALRTK